MARMHTRRRGQSGSTKPYRAASPSWVEFSADEIEELIMKHAKKGAGPSEVGRILRDVYGVPSTKLITGKKVQKIINESELKPELPEDISALIRRAVALNNHLQIQKKDLKSKRALSLVEAKIRRLSRYYKTKKVMDSEWKYDIKKAKLLVD